MRQTLRDRKLTAAETRGHKSGIKEEETMLAGRLSWVRGRKLRVIAGALFSLLSAATSVSAQNTFPASGNVGIGTSNPVLLLDIRGQVRIGDSASALLNLGSGGAFGYMSATGSEWLWVSPPNGNVSFQISGGGNGFVIRDTNSNAVFSALQNGRIGVGTSSPATKFHVAGDAQIDGNIAAKYQDVAEWVPATEKLAAGTVVVIDDTATNRVRPASHAYDTRIAGVVSAHPGLLLGEEGETKLKVAHSGRVRVKVDAQRRPIAAGDLLVSSPTSGYAMRSEPVTVDGIAIHRPGTLIGKALEALETGQGEILVLLMLQ